MHALREQAESGGDEVAVCWWDGQPYDVSNWWTAEERQKRPGELSRDVGRDKAQKNKSRPQRGGEFSLNFYLCLVFRGDLVCVISQDISRYIVPLCPVSCDITRYGISRYRIISTSRNIWDWYGDIVSRRFISRHRTLFCCQLGAPVLAPREYKKRILELQKLWY